MINGWKTVIVSVLLVVVGALQGIDWINLLGQAMVNASTAGWIVTGLGVVMFVLRALTNGPIGGAGPK